MIIPATMILTLNVTIKICYHNSGIVASLHYKEIRKHWLQIRKKTILTTTAAIKGWALCTLNQSRFYKCNIQTTTWPLYSSRFSSSLSGPDTNMFCWSFWGTTWLLLYLIRIMVDNAIMNSIVYQWIFYTRFRRWYLGVGLGFWGLSDGWLDFTHTCYEFFYICCMMLSIVAIWYCLSDCNMNWLKILASKFFIGCISHFNF